jgi:hypothetical protein
MICYNNPDFRSQIDQSGAVFRAYPGTMLTADALAASLVDGNLSRPHLLMLQAAEQLTPFVIDELQREAAVLLAAPQPAQGPGAVNPPVWQRLPNPATPVPDAGSLEYRLHRPRTAAPIIDHR